MPRDPNGVYTLPPGNPVISGTLVSSDWANDTMPDLGGEMSDSLSRTGKGGMQAAFRAIDGSELEPSMTFISDVITGRYLFSNGDMRDTVSNQDTTRYTAEGFFVRIDDEWVLVNPTLTGRKNLLINGGYDIWQRGVGPVATGYTADRWRIFVGVTDVQQYVWADGSNRPWKYGLRVTRNVAGAAVVEQRIESLDAADTVLKPLTFSMQATQVATGFPDSFDITLSYANADDDFSSVTAIQTINVPTTGTQIDLEVNFDPMPTEARRGLSLAIGANVGVAADWVCSGCQLEVGTKRTQFERTPVAETLALCKRYYQDTRRGVPSAPPTAYMAATTVRAWGSGVFPTVMRAIPEVIVYSYNETPGKISVADASEDFAGNAIAIFASVQGFPSLSNDSALNVGTMYYFKYSADAEL